MFFTQKKSEDQFDDLKNHNLFIFALDENGIPFFKTIIKHTSKNDAESAGTFITDLSNGLYYKNMMDTILSLSYQDTHIAKFIELMFAHMGTLYTKKRNATSNDEPLVRPTVFSKFLSRQS